MARPSSNRGVRARHRGARAAADGLERQRLFDAFVEIGAPRVEMRFAGRLAALPPVAALEQRLFDLWLAHVTEQLRPLANDLFELARALVELTRSLTVTQRQTHLDVPDSFEDDDFIARKMTILASGLCNCEMSNFIVWSALRKLGHRAYFFETGLQDQLGGSHLLLYVFGPQGAAFVDAWSDVACFHLSGFIPELPNLYGRWLASRYGGRHPAGMPALSELQQFGFKTHGLYPAEAIRAGRIRPGPRDDDHPRASVATRCVDLAERAPAEAIWSDYLALRCLHLEGKLEQPAHAYKQFAARPELPNKLRIVVTALAQR